MGEGSGTSGIILFLHCGFEHVVVTSNMYCLILSFLKLSCLVIFAQETKSVSHKG